MFSYIRDPYDPLQAFGLFRRRMDHLFRELDDVVGTRTQPREVWPRVNLADTKDAFILQAEIPGLGVEDIDLSVTAESLTLRGERKEKAPEGYSVHRQERRGLRFSRSVALPARVDVERVSAEVRNGLLVVTLPKHPEDRPRSITIKTN
ncbi:MAG: Hsp20/alpha crystallin family protein [Myxococcales bacterium]|nr:Hsp20/alpha crystallin family protein [Myxococcales bacterium]